MASRSLTLKFLSDTSGINKGVKDVNRKMDSVGATAKKVGGFLAAAFAVDVIKDFAVEAFKLGEQMKGVRAEFNRIATGTNLEDLREATSGTVSDLALMKQSVLAVKLGLDAAQLPAYFEFAAKTAAATGESIEYLTDSIVKGIGRESILIIDNLGINMKLARQEGETFAETVERLATTLNEQMGNVALPATLELSAAWDNFKTAIGEAMVQQGMLSDAIRGFASLLNSLAGWIPKFGGLIEDTWRSIREWIVRDTGSMIVSIGELIAVLGQGAQLAGNKSLSSAAIGAAAAIKQMGEDMQSFTLPTRRAQKTIEDFTITAGTNTETVKTNSTAIEGNTKAKQGNIVVTDNLDDLIQDINKSIEAQTEAVKNANFGYEQLIKSYADSYETGLDFNAEIGKTPGIIDETTIATDKLTNSLTNLAASLAGQATSGGGMSLGSALSQILGTVGGIVGGPVGSFIGSTIGNILGNFEGGTFNSTATVSYPTARAGELATLARLAQEGNHVAINKLASMGYGAADYEGLFNAGGGGISGNGQQYTGSFSDIGGMTVNVSGFVGSESQLANEINKVLTKNTTEYNY